MSGRSCPAMPAFLASSRLAQPRRRASCLPNQALSCLVASHQAVPASSRLSHAEPRRGMSRLPSPVPPRHACRALSCQASPNQDLPKRLAPCLPCLVSPCLRLGSPCLFKPSHTGPAMPCRVLLSRVIARLALPAASCLHPAAPHHASHVKSVRATPALPRLAQPTASSTRLVSPDLAVPASPSLDASCHAMPRPTNRACLGLPRRT